MSERTNELKTKTRYNRTQVYTFFDLPDLVKAELNADCNDAEDIERIENDSYYKFDYDKRSEYLPASMFLRVNYPNETPRNSRFNGYYGTSAFTTYAVRLSADGESAIIAEIYS